MTVDELITEMFNKEPSREVLVYDHEPIKFNEDKAHINAIRTTYYEIGNISLGLNQLCTIEVQADKAKDFLENKVKLTNADYRFLEKISTVTLDGGGLVFDAFLYCDPAEDGRSLKMVSNGDEIAIADLSNTMLHQWSKKIISDLEKWDSGELEEINFEFLSVE